MLKINVTFYPESGIAPALVLAGQGEDVRAPRELARIEREGWVVDDNVTVSMKAYLAARRQGSISTDMSWEAWVDAVAELDVELTDKQIQQAVIAGRMTQDQAEQLKALRSAEGEGHTA